MTDYNPNVDHGETYAELIALIEQGHQVPESRLIHAKRRDDDQAAELAATKKLAADVSAAKKQAEQSHAAELVAAEPEVRALAADHAAAIAAYGPKWHAANDAIRERNAAWKEVNRVFRGLKSAAEVFSDDPDQPINNSWLNAVVVDGESHVPGRITPISE